MALGREHRRTQPSIPQEGEPRVDTKAFSTGRGRNRGPNYSANPLRLRWNELAGSLLKLWGEEVVGEWAQNVRLRNRWDIWLSWVIDFKGWWLGSYFISSLNSISIILKSGYLVDILWYPSLTKYWFISPYVTWICIHLIYSLMSTKNSTQ